MVVRRALVAMMTAAALGGIGAGAAGPAAAGDDARVGLKSGYVADPGPAHPYFAAYWTVGGAVPGREGNFHRLFADGDPDEGVRVVIGDYTCPGDDARCTFRGELTLWTDPDQPTTFSASGALVMKASGTVVVDAGPEYGYDLALAPTGPIRYSVAPYHRLYERWDSLRGSVTGKIGPIDLASPGVRLEAIQVQKMRGFTWVGPGAPDRREESPTKRGRPARSDLTSDERDATTTWIRMGGVTGRPGNAHSGYGRAVHVWFPDGHGGFTESEWNDWNCPAGVRPPAFAKRGSRCSLLRTEHGTSDQVAMWRDGLRGVAVRGRVPTTVIAPTGVTDGHRAVDYRLQPAGDTFLMTGWFRSLSTTASGRLGWADLDSRAVTTRGGLLTVDWYDTECTFFC